MRHCSTALIFLALLFTEPSEASFQGFYLGQSFGLACNVGKFSSESTSDAVFGLPYTLTLTAHNKDENESLWGEIYCGWGCTYFNRLYVGVRAGANLSDFDVKNCSTSSLNHQISPDIPISSSIATYPYVKLWLAEVTLDQKIGWMICPNTLIFALVGAALNRPSLKGSSAATSSSGGDTPFDGNVEFSLDNNGQLLHFRYGAGLEYQFLCNWAFQFLYTQTEYGKLRFSQSDDVTGGSDASLSYSTKIKAKISKKVFSVGFVRYY